MTVAWLIERNIPDGKPRWWARDKRWTENAWEAARYPHRAVCEQRIRLDGLLYAKAVEHGFEEACSCPAGSYNPGNVHEDYCPLGGHQ